MAEDFEIQDGILIRYHGCGTEVVIPEGLQEIGERAFASCESMTSVIIPEGVTKINAYAFYACSSLVSCVFPASLESIEACAFWKCTGLRDVRFPEYIRYIEDAAFSGCSALTSVRIPGSVWEVSSAFSGCSGLESAVIEEGVQEINGMAFVECTELRSVIVPASIEGIGFGAFSHCPDLTFVCIENTFAHRYCVERKLPFIFDYQFKAFHGTIPTGLERLSSPFLADEEKPYIFISYSHKDRERVLPILRTLYESGWKVWYDEGLTIGDQYDEVLEKHVRDCSVVLFFATLNSRESAYIRENELPWASKYGQPVIQCLLDAGTDMGLPESTFAASVSQAEIETALSATDGIARGERRTAKGISVLVNPADRYEAYDAKGSALSLYAAESEASARAILLEVKNSGCVFYETGGRGTEERLLRRCASLVVFLDRASLRDQGLMKILTWAWQSGKDLAVCQLEGIEEEELPEELSGLHKMQWLDFSHGITGDMIKKLVRHLEKRGCRNTSAMPGFEYEKTKKGIVLKRYTGREAEPWIESAYGGIPVTEIADEAFRNCRHLQSIRIPDTVEKIGEHAFEECTNLSSLVFGSGLTELGRRSFCGCTSLTSVKLPEGIKKIGEGAFAGCSGLTSIDLPESVKTICGYAFSGCSGLKAFHFPNGVKRIETAVCNECKALTTVSLPEDTRSIEGEAFRLCDSLTSVVLPDGAGSIGTEAFLGCENLVSVHIPASVRWIDERAFYGCRNLTVTCPERSYALKYCMEHSIPVRKVKVRFLERLFPGKRR